MKSDKDEKSRQKLYEDNLFREALKKTAAIQGDRLIKENQTLNQNVADLSEIKKAEFETRLRKALNEKKFRNNSSTMRPIQKIAVIILIIGIMASISFFSVDALRVRILNFFMEIRPEYTEFRLEEENQDLEDSRIVNWENAFMPTYIPAGYVVESSENGELAKSITLVNTDGKIIDYAEYNEAVSFNYDTEDAVLQDITVKDETGTLIIKNDNYSIIWTLGNSIFVIRTQISEEETKKIAESVKFLK